MVSMIPPGMHKCGSCSPPPPPVVRLFATIRVHQDENCEIDALKSISRIPPRLLCDE